MVIDYNPSEYTLIETESIDDELTFKFVRFNTGYYGVISCNPKENLEAVVLVSPNKGSITTVSNGDKIEIPGGISCKSFLVFARDAKKYIENAPTELVVLLGKESPVEYREIISRDDGKSLVEKIEICREIMEMKLDESFYYKYGDQILITIICFIVILGILNILGVI